MPTKTDDKKDEASEEAKAPAKRTRKSAAKADDDAPTKEKKPAAKRGRKSAAEKEHEAKAAEGIAADVAIPAPRRKVSLLKGSAKKEGAEEKQTDLISDADAANDYARDDEERESRGRSKEDGNKRSKADDDEERPARNRNQRDSDGERGRDDDDDKADDKRDDDRREGRGEGRSEGQGERRDNGGGGRNNDRRRQREEERRNRRERRRKEARGGGGPGGKGRRDFDDDTDEETMEEAGEDNSIQQRRLNLAELKELPMEKLYELAEEFEVENYANYPQQELLGKFLQKQAERKGHSYTVGTLAIGGKEKYGFLRSPKYSYMAGPDDIYVSPNQIRKYALRAGDTIAGTIRRPSKSEKFWALLKIDSINGETINDHKQKTLFTNLTSVYPNEQLRLEHDPKDLTSRVIDLMCPIGKGQRGLIVAPPRTGKTVILQKIAKAIETNHPEVFLFVLLIDERPEEVTDMRRTVRGEVVASTFDEKPQRHAEVSEIVIEKAKRLVEAKKDVVILLDSITRLGRAYNVLAPSQGKLLSGGIEANALMMPKKFFGAARNVEEGGSLTILGTALVDTGSKMDEYIFEEFKGTGNMEMHLDRVLMDRRVFPAMNIRKSGTRKEELLLDEKTLQRTWLLRKALKDLDVVETMEFFVERLRKTDTNQEFLDQMNI